MDGREIGKIINSVKNYLGVAKSNKLVLEGYASEQDYQVFMGASEETQKANLELIEDAVKAALKSGREHLSTALNSAQEFLKIGEEMLKGLEESGLDNEEIAKGKREMEE